MNHKSLLRKSYLKLWFPSKSSFHLIFQNYPGTDLGGGCRGCAPPPPWDDQRFSNTTGVLFIGVEVEQGTSAPPPNKKSWIRPCYHYVSTTVIQNATFFNIMFLLGSWAYLEMLMNRSVFSVKRGWEGRISTPCPPPPSRQSLSVCALQSPP